MGRRGVRHPCGLIWSCPTENGSFPPQSPSSFNAQETLCTLKFGQRAMKVDLGKATKRRTAHDVELTSDAAVRGEAASGADCCLEL